MILCVGTTPAVQRSMTFQKFELDEVNRAVAVLDSAAGKSVNVARVLTTLGKRVLATGFLGGDSGQFVRSEMDREGIAHDFVQILGRTRTCITVMDQTHGRTTELVEEARPVDEHFWADLENRIASHLPRCRAMVLSGGLPLNAPEGFYAHCCELAQPHKIPVILDARGEPLRQAMKYRPVMVKPNRAELGSTFNFAVQTDQQLKDAIKRLIDLGAQATLITMGAKGAVLSDGNQFWMIPSPQVCAVNPIGSGDAVTAGYTAGLMDGLSLTQCAILGIACGAANAITPIPGVVHLADVERLRAAIYLEEW